MAQRAQPIADGGAEPSRCRFRAQLFGGHGDGLIIELARLEPTIAVYRNGGAPFASDTVPEPTGGARLLGNYELVGPVGPEIPVYIPTP